MGRGVKRSRAKWLAGAALVAAALLLPSQFVSPPEGVALSAGARAFNRLKNRVALPGAADLDERVTLDALLSPGDDRGRWSASRAAAVEGYVVAVREGGIESANSFSLLRRDTHIEVGARPDAPTRERVILEVTPALRDWARSRGMDWTTSALARELTGRRCRFEGWLLFDFNHAGESEHLNPEAPANWRATAWEIHPVTSIKILAE